MPTPIPLPELAADARERAIQLLTDRYADGTLDEAGFESQLARLRSASDAPALEALARDLAQVAPPAVVRRPAAPPPAPTGAAVQAPPHEARIRTVLGETRRQGWWPVPRHLEVTAILGSVRLDVRDATLPDVAEIVVDACLAEVVLVVPPGVTVEFEVSTVLGNAVSKAPARIPAPGVPHLRVTGSSVLSEVKVVERAREA